MALTIGTRIGPYELTSPLGEGGMGVVYRAHDTNLGRDVAIKSLPDVFAGDPDRLSRLQREAQVLASLNHPNIAQIYGLEQSGQIRCIVMELVEGETLQDRLRRGPIPPDEALPIAKQICEALEAAHEKGIVHRDLKPANVKIMADSKVKVLDFGLAKAFDEVGNSNLSNSPTMSLASTNAGVILGTAAYMSPEQAKGFAADQRTDVFSFGSILYEMLTGKPAFAGDTISEILASVLKSEPDLNLLSANLNPRLRELLQRTLAKNLKRRFHAIADVRFEIEEALNVPALIAPSSAAAIRKLRPLWMASSAIAAVLIASLAIPALRHLRETSPPEMRVEIGTPSTSVPLEFALSPDGRYIVFVASGDGPQRLWLRPLDKTEAQPLAGTDGAGFPFWSADGRSIGFFASSKLYRVDIAGGPPQVLANASGGRGGTWNADGTILFAATSNSPLFRITASGGEPAPIAQLDTAHNFSHRFPQFLPDGRHFLFYTTGSTEASGIYLGSLDGGETKRLAAADVSGADGQMAGIDKWRHPPAMARRRQGTLLRCAGRETDGRAGVLSGSTFEAGTPEALFQTRIAGVVASIFKPQYAVFRDGRFLINQPVEASTTTPIMLILNWKPPAN